VSPAVAFETTRLFLRNGMETIPQGATTLHCRAMEELNLKH